MGTYTTNLELYKPIIGENGWGTLVNENFDKIDATSITGVVQLYAGSSAPSGWLICNGQAVSRTEYAKLYSVIGTTYGTGDGSTTFNLPDLQGRVPIGVSSSYALGSVGGSDTHTLTIEQLPSHTHDGSSLEMDEAGSHVHSYTDYASYDSNSPLSGCEWGEENGVQTRNTSSAGAHLHSITGETGSVGSGSPHNNMQPYITLNYIIRAQ